MELVDIDVWYLTDNIDGENVYEALLSIGLKVSLLNHVELKEDNSENRKIFILDFKDKSCTEIMDILKNESTIQKNHKFVVLPEDQIDNAVALSKNILNVEFIDRPLNKREFVLIIEKTVMIENYRSMMKRISQESEDRIEAYESLMHIHKKDLFIDEKEKVAFEKIIKFEKNLVNEQKNLNNALKDFTFLRQKEMFEMRKLLHAKEMVGHLRHKELLDANEIIKAQQSVLEYSTKELDDAIKIIEAIERTGELGRNEAKELHEKLKTLIQKNNQLSKENVELKLELKKYKK